MTGERSVAVAAGSGTLQVTLLGGFSVRVGSRPVPSLRSRQPVPLQPEHPPCPGQM